MLLYTELHTVEVMCIVNAILIRGFAHNAESGEPHGGLDMRLQGHLVRFWPNHYFCKIPLVFLQKARSAIEFVRLVILWYTRQKQYIKWRKGIGCSRTQFIYVAHEGIVAVLCKN